MAGLGDILTTIQNAVTGANNLTQLLTQATVNSSSLRVQITGASTTVGTVTTVNSGTGLTGGPITSSGTLAVSLSILTNSLGADVTTTSTGYFDGPSVAQGSSGTWFASGNVTCSSTAGAQSFIAKLWDGTTVVDSGYATTGGVSFGQLMSLSGYLVSPSGNIKISVSQIGGSSVGKINFNVSGNSKDSTISVVRIA